MGENRRGLGRQQAGGAQEARQEDQGQVSRRAAEKKGEGRVIFNRFARETRRCVVAAVEEARMLGHDSIGDEDLLLGILRADEGVAAEALSSLGVTLEGARKESEGMLSEALSSVGVSLEEVRREAGGRLRDAHPRLPQDPVLAPGEESA